MRSWSFKYQPVSWSLLRTLTFLILFSHFHYNQVGEIQNNKNTNERHAVRTPSLSPLCFKIVLNISIKLSSVRKHVRLNIPFASPLDVSPYTLHLMLNLIIAAAYSLLTVCRADLLLSVIPSVLSKPERKKKRLQNITEYLELSHLLAPPYSWIINLSNHGAVWAWLCPSWRLVNPWHSSHFISRPRIHVMAHNLCPGPQTIAPG